MERRAATIKKIRRHALELRASQLLLEVEWTGLTQRDVGQVDLRLARRGEFDLGLLSCLLEALPGDLVLRQISAVLVLELLDQPVDDPGIPVIATEPVVAVGGLHLEDTIADLQQ